MNITVLAMMLASMLALTSSFTWKRSPGLRAALISAITACAEQRFQKKARRFLLGLSTDELQYIAAFLGACVLESLGRSALRRHESADGTAELEQVGCARANRLSDQEHKMILLLEYLRRSRTYSAVLNSRIQMLR
jgi:hypothetical protein